MEATIPMTVKVERFISCAHCGGHLRVRIARTDEDPSTCVVEKAQEIDDEEAYRGWLRDNKSGNIPTEEGD